VKAQASGLSLEVEPKKPVGKAVFLQYKAMLRKLYKEQTARRVINMHWDGIWTEAFEDLEKHVKDRVPRKKKETYEEKACGEFAPYIVAEKYDEIEEALWLAGFAPARRSVNCALRHRFCFLYLTSGVLRSESLYRAELSNFMSLRVPKKDKDVHAMYLMINQIAIGKTTHCSMQCGRATRHKNVKLCCVGAMALYIQYRFFNTREFHDFTTDDWLNKEGWFDIKLLVDLTGDNTTVMNNDSYSGKLKDILQQLSLPVCDLLHLGRKLGSKILDSLEEETSEIKRMGQWSDGVWESAYSSKLPFGPIRKLAGYQATNEFYFNTRTTVKVPETLLEATPIGEWVYEAYENVRSTSIETGKGKTAVQVLRFFMDLNEVFLQDAAALFVLDADRHTHPLFAQLPVFQKAEFKQYTEDMRSAIQHESNPMDADLEKVLPGVHRWHQANNQEMQTLSTTVTDFIQEVRTAVKAIHEDSSQRNREAGRQLASSFLQVAKSLVSNEREHPNDPVTLDDFEFESFLPRTPTNDSPTDFSSNKPATYNMVHQHKTLADMWDEWHGIGKFHDSYGGIQGRENVHKSKWRKHINSAFFCRTKQCIFAIKVYADEKEIEIKAALELLQKEYTNCGCSVANMYRRFQTMGILEKKNSRGRTKLNN